MGTSHRYFNPEFKEKAVLLSYTRNNNSKTERELNIPQGLLHKWRREYELLGNYCFLGKGKPKVKMESLVIAKQSKKRRTSKNLFFSPEFKEEVVQQSYRSTNISKMERELNIPNGRLHSWRKIYEKFGSGCFCGYGRSRIDQPRQQIMELEKKCLDSELNCEILKNCVPYFRKGSLAVFEFIKENERKYTIHRMCRVLQVCESSYRIWKAQPISNTKKRITLLKEKIAETFKSSHGFYGCTKIAKELTNNGTKISYTQVGLYMKEMRLRPKAKRKFKITTDSKHNHYTSPNLLNQKFNSTSESMVWVSDITYIQTDKRFLYLTIIMDLYDRKIIGWSLSTTMSALKTTIAAWDMAVANRSVSEGLIFHSDRGVQYACRAFTNRLQSYKGIIRSMSRRENSLDNAPAESFFNTLKRELIYQNKLLPKKDLKILIIDYIENWYNKIRIHSALNYLTIEEFNAMHKP
ncbi:IS3 family transposase [Flavobacterium sp. F52]|uniref:IS3 family transposase n=1 Tax=Flavobacterium sp. F52 TaxID=1202532 RepID=UPI000272E44C|nr:IS3 family transposase [Flavobacterium sp. F52]EJF99090.1 integrase catalytic subunit [Flavobacterium sp. F52]